MNKAFVYVSVALLAVVIISTSIQVFTRYIMNASLSGTDEVARFVFVWMSMLGASVCVSTHGHAAVSVLNDFLKGRSKLYKYHCVLIEALMVIGAAVIVIYGTKLAIYTSAQKSAGLGIPISFTYACLPVGGVGMILNGILNIIEAFLGEEGGEEK